MAGIEPTLSVLETDAYPLCYIHIFKKAAGNLGDDPRLNNQLLTYFMKRLCKACLSRLSYPSSRYTDGFSDDMLPPTSMHTTYSCGEDWIRTNVATGY